MKDILKYKDFMGTVHFSTDDEVFHGKLIGINDLVTFEGCSVVELKNSFEKAVEDYIELCRNVNKSPNISYKGTFNVIIKPVLHEQAARRSMELGVSLNQFVELAIEEKIKLKS